MATNPGQGFAAGVEDAIYYAANGDRMFYYFESDILKQIRSASGENEFILDVIEISDTAAPERIGLPEDYEWLP